MTRSPDEPSRADVEGAVEFERGMEDDEVSERHTEALDTDSADTETTGSLARERPRVLVPVKVLDGESIPEGVHELLAHAHVVLLGIHVLPEQTPPGQARIQFEERAQTKLAQFQADFEAAGAVVDRRLVFTHREQQTIDRQIYEHDCLAVLVPNATTAPSDLLVAIHDTVGRERIVRLVAGLLTDNEMTVTLYHGLEESAAFTDAESLLEAITGDLVDSGVERSRITHRIEDDGTDVDTIASVAQGYDAVIMGETDPSVVTYVFGMPANQVAERFLGPVLVVQRERETE